MHRNALLASAAALAVAFVPAIAGAAPPLAHVRGTVTAFDGRSIDVLTTTGTVHLTVAPAAKVIEVLPSSRSAIKANTFVGIASNGDAPGANAREVVVFPESMRGSGEGHYGWDLPGGGNRMTNGTVAAPKSMMTNGSVGAMSGGSGPLVINVTYKGGSSRITVPANAPIVTFAAGTPAMVVKGAHVIVFASETDGKPAQAVRIAVGKDGLVPPM